MGEGADIPEGGELPIIAYGDGNVSVRGASSLGPWNDDSKRAGTVNTHCWKVARVVFVSSDKGAQWANMYWGASGNLKLTGVWWFGCRAYSRLEGTCMNAGCSMVRDTCVLVTVEPSVVSPWLVFCLRLVKTLKGMCWVMSERVNLQVASAVLLL